MLDYESISKMMGKPQINSARFKHTKQSRLSALFEFVKSGVSMRAFDEVKGYPEGTISNFKKSLYCGALGEHIELVREMKLIFKEEK
jgi:hypothetical protein